MTIATNHKTYSPPFPWFGGKSRIAPLVWERFGDVKNYVEPFFGSGAVLFLRPPTDHAIATETVNDKDGFVANFWRAAKADPEAVAKHADWPVNENDLHARHAWLVAQKADFVPRLEGDPDYYDPKIAGWWVWGICSWIGAEFCSGKGPWQSIEGRLVKSGDAGRGVNRQLPHLGNAGRGVNRKLPVESMFVAIADRLRHVRVCCGDWERVCGSSPTVKNGLTGVFLDPPYSAEAKRDGSLYAVEDLRVAHKVREWALANGDHPLMRIALCGYEGEHEMPGDWACVPWKAVGGYGSQGKGKGRANAGRERIWFSPHCLRETDAADHKTYSPHCHNPSLTFQ